MAGGGAGENEDHGVTFFGQLPGLSTSRSDHLHGMHSVSTAPESGSTMQGQGACVVITAEAPHRRATPTRSRFRQPGPHRS